MIDRGFTRERNAQRFLAAIPVSDMQQTKLPLKEMGAAFSVNRCAFRSRVNPL